MNKCRQVACGLLGHIETNGLCASCANANVRITDIGTHYASTDVFTWVDDLLIHSKSLISFGHMRKDNLKGTQVHRSIISEAISRRLNGQETMRESLAWSAKTYITSVTEHIEKLYRVEPKNYQSPMESTYRPELDVTELLTESERTQYQMLIGCGNWVVTLRRYDVHYAVVTLARHSATPRKGRIGAMLRVFGYLEFYKKHRIVVDPAKPYLDKTKIVKHHGTNR